MFAIQTILSKAQENAQAARICHRNHFYNATANRAYYACAQAAVASLVQHNKMPDIPSHKSIQREFLKLFNPKLPELPRMLSKLRTHRETSDYEDINITKSQSLDCLSLSNDFLSQLRQHLGRQ